MIIILLVCLYTLNPFVAFFKEFIVVHHPHSPTITTTPITTTSTTTTTITIITAIATTAIATIKKKVRESLSPWCCSTAFHYCQL